MHSIYSENREKVSSFILANNGSHDEAKDIFQEAIIAMYENVRDGKFKGDSALGSYLYSIAKFKWFNQIKKNQIRETHHHAAEYDQIHDSPMVALVKGERKKELMSVFNELGKQCKHILIESIYHNASMKEIAASGNFSSEQIVRNKKYKCLKKLKEIITSNPRWIQKLKGHD